MKKLTLGHILFSNYNLETKWALMQIPQPYVATHVEDYLDNKHIFKEEYVSLVVPNIFLRPVEEDGLLQSYNHQDGRSLLFTMEDRTGSAEVLWPLRRSGSLDENVMQSFIDQPRQVDGLMLVRHQPYDSSFITHILEGSYERGIEETMRELGWEKE
ncbi:MAG: hypothetical protein ACOC32_00230 [Nanoarchaeota archaeon]